MSVGFDGYLDDHDATVFDPDVAGVDDGPRTRIARDV